MIQMAQKEEVQFISLCSWTYVTSEFSEPTPKFQIYGRVVLRSYKDARGNYLMEKFHLHESCMVTHLPASCAKDNLQKLSGTQMEHFKHGYEDTQFKQLMQDGPSLQKFPRRKITDTCKINDRPMRAKRKRKRTDTTLSFTAFKRVSPHHHPKRPVQSFKERFSLQAIAIPV